MSEQLTNGEVAVLNAAREILHEHASGFPDDYGQVRVCVFAELAEDAIFAYLNNASTHGKVSLSYAQLHRAPEPVAVEVEA